MNENGEESTNERERHGEGSKRCKGKSFISLKFAFVYCLGWHSLSFDAHFAWMSLSEEVFRPDGISTSLFAINPHCMNTIESIWWLFWGLQLVKMNEMNEPKQWARSKTQEKTNWKTFLQPLQECQERTKTSFGLSSSLHYISSIFPQKIWTRTLEVFVLSFRV